MIHTKELTWKGLFDMLTNEGMIIVVDESEINNILNDLGIDFYGHTCTIEILDEQPE